MSRYEEVRQAEAREIGGRIRQLRIKQGWTLADLGAVAHLSAQHICIMEQGQIMPKRQTLERLARALNVPIDTFITHASHPSSKPGKMSMLEWPYQVIDGPLAGLHARIIAPPKKAYKPLPLDGPDPVWCQFERLPAQWFPKGRLRPLEK